MGMNYFILYSHKKERLLSARKKIDEKLTKNRYTYRGPIDLKPTPSRQAMRIVNRQRISDPLHTWLRDVRPSRIEYLVSKQNATRFWGTVFAIPSRHTQADKLVGGSIRRQDVRLVVRESSSSTRIPFSYDPQQTYKTEPERWEL